MRKHTAILTLLALILGQSAFALAGEVRLRQQATVSGDRIRLGDVADLRGLDAEQLANVEIAAFSGNKTTEVTLVQLQRQLSGAGANLGRVSLSGFGVCQVQRGTPAPAAPVAQPVAEPVVQPALLSVEPAPAPAPVIANPQAAVALNSVISVQQVIERYLREHLEYHAGEMQLTFAAADAALLSQSALDGRWELEPLSTARLGRLPLAVRKWQGTTLVSEQRLYVQVSRQTLAAVATRPLRRGQTIAPGDVEVQAVTLDADRGQPVTELRQLIGQLAQRSVRAGEVVYAADVQEPVLVQRGEVVAVQCVSGGLVIRMTGRAEEDGSRGQIINVRNDRSRSLFQAKVIGAREVQVVLEGASEAPAGGVH